MKHQYFGDVNDYRKYGLLRALRAGGDLSLCVCWMLTENDGRGDGRKIGYLRQPERWRDFDPTLFDALARAVMQDEDRRVDRIESSGLLDGVVFHDEILADDIAERRRSFERAIHAARGCDLVFFDPDNGVEVASVPCGRRGSSKYLYWPEVAAAFEAGHSLLIYQHFARVRRDRYIRDLAMRIRSEVACTRVTSLATTHVLFVLIERPEHGEALRRAIERLRAGWPGQFRIGDHVAPMVTSAGCGAGS